MEDLRGTIINQKYLIRSVLGKGGMGVVYRSAQLDAAGEEVRDVALKMILPELARDDPNLAKRFVREVRAAARLRGPNTITVHDFGQWGPSELYYVMELVEGPTLKQVIRSQGPLAVDQVVSIGRQICEALCEAHGLAQPVVHRDLKPANVFIEKWPESVWVRVGDFGVAKVLGEEITGLTGDTSYLGTPLYMAPEQCTPGAVIDPRTDLYALGVILYEMLSGKPPFTGEYMSVMYQHLHEAPPMLGDGVPASLRILIARLLAKQSDDRPSDAVEVEKELQCVATDVSTSQELSTRDVRPRRDESSPRNIPGRTEPDTGKPESRIGNTGRWGIALAGVIGGLALAFALTFLGVFDPPSTPGASVSSAQARRLAAPPANVGAEHRFAAEEKSEILEEAFESGADARIAVLEFRNERGNDEKHDWIRTALQTSFSTELNKLRDLRVFSREALPEGGGSYEAIKALGATKMITGSFAVLGDIIRVDARLVDMGTGMQEGAESVEGQLEQFFALQKRLALKMLERLPVQVAEADRKAIARKNPSENQGAALDAYRLMLQGEGLDEEPATEDEDAAPEVRSERSSFSLSRMVAFLVRQIGPAPARAEDRNGAELEIRNVLEDYRLALEKGDLNGIQRTRGVLSEHRRKGLEQYFQMADGLRVEFDHVQIEQVDLHRFNVSYVRRDFFADRRTGENVSLEVQLQNAAVREGENWRIENRKALVAD